MDPLSTLLSLSFIIFSLLISAIMFIFRIIFEYIFKSLVNNKLWEDVVLPILPVLIGFGLAFIAKAYPYGASFTTTSGRLAFGAVAGLLSGLLYRFVKALIQQKISSLLPAPASTPALTPTMAAATTTLEALPENTTIKTMGADLHLPPPPT